MDIKHNKLTKHSKFKNEDNIIHIQKSKTNLQKFSNLPAKS